MRRSFANTPYSVILLLFFLIGCKEASTVDNSNILDSLDQKIEEKAQYIKKKELFLDNIKKQYSQATDIAEQYKYNNNIIESYLGFQSDSAFSYISKNEGIAQHQHNEQWLFETQLKKANLLSSTGLFVEAYDLLRQIDKRKLRGGLPFVYNSAYESLYTNLYDYAGKDKEISESYKIKLLNYYRNGYKSLEKDSYFTYLFAYNINRVLGNWNSAERNIDVFIKKSPEDSRLKAIGYYCKAYIAKNTNDLEAQEKYLALSAIEDIKSATTENRSMQELAYLMYQNKEYQKAFRYLQIAVADANFYNARHRNFQISQVYPIIEKSYLLEINSKNYKLQRSVILISLLLLALGVVVYFLFKQVKLISKSRNASLELNKKLNLLNSKLNESNKIKDNYMAYFITQSGKYFDRLDKFKSLLTVAVESGNLDKIKKLLIDRKNNDFSNEKFYKEFDEAFLDIYPHFVTEINKLMKPEFQYTLKMELNTELRIFALIRLGINDLQQISEFLRYSLRTIYNYKSKVKAKSVVENDDFEAYIMKIDAIV